MTVTDQTDLLLNLSRKSRETTGFMEASTPDPEVLTVLTRKNQSLEELGVAAAEVGLAVVVVSQSQLTREMLQLLLSIDSMLALLVRETNPVVNTLSTGAVVIQLVIDHAALQEGNLPLCDV